MVQKIFKHPYSFAIIVATLILILYPFSHFPLLPGIGISPFQFAGVGIALLGGVVSLWWMVKNKNTIPKKAVITQIPIFWTLVLLGWLSASFLWGGHTSHELYYISLVLVAFLFAIGIYGLFRASKIQINYLTKVILVVGVVLSIWAVWQFIGESIGIDRAYTNICKTCLQHDIGFARASGFSQEPEHFSTVLLGPLVLMLVLLMQNRQRKAQSLLWVGAISIVAALLLASSRSGLLALSFILVSFGVFATLQHKGRFAVKLCGAFAGAIIVTLALIGWSGTVGDSSGSKYTLERYVAHVSGGLVVFGDEQKRLSEVESSIEQKVESKAGPSQFNYVTDATDYGPSGAIVYSTESRLETYKAALSLWTQNGKNFLIGVGWGNFGTAAHMRNPVVFNQDTIVNNQYLQIAVELGLVGVGLFVLSVVYVGRFIYVSALDGRLKFAIAVLFIGYGIQLMFYSGLHLLQLWLSASVVAYVIYLHSNKKKLHKASARRLK